MNFEMALAETRKVVDEIVIDCVYEATLKLRESNERLRDSIRSLIQEKIKNE